MAESKPIQGSDLINDNAFTKGITSIGVFRKEVDLTTKSILAMNKATQSQLKASGIATTSAQLKDQNKLLDESRVQRVALAQLDALELKATNDLNKAKKVEADLEKKKLADQEKEIKNQNKINSAYDVASKKLNELRKQYKDLAIQGKAADVSTQNLLHEIQLLDKELKDVDASVGQFNREVGNYKGAIKDAISETGIFTAGLNDLGAESQQIAAGFGKVVSQLQELKKAEDAGTKGAFTLKNALKASGITLIITAIGALFSFFTSSREGALEFELALNKLKGTLDVVLGSMKGLAIGIGKTIEALYYANTFQLKKATDAALEAKDGFDQFNDSLSTEKIETQIKAYDELTIAIFKTEDQIDRLNIALQAAQLDEEDFNEIAGDVTRSLNEQKNALNLAAGARKDAATITKEIADLEYLNAQRQIKIDLRKNGVSEAGISLLEKEGYQAFLNSEFTLKVTPEAIKAIQDKFLAQQRAADALNDLDRQEAMRRRELAQNEIINNIELIRSKKLGADAQVKILTEQVSDEKIQLETREKYFDQLAQKQNEALNEEVRLLSQFKTSANEQAISEKEIFDLINEQDAVKLANRLKELRDTKLSEAQEAELAKVILEAQNNQIAREKQIKAFQEERIKREQKLLQLNREIAIINEQSLLTDIQDIESKRQQILTESNNNILQQNNVFNKQLLSDRQKAADDEQAILEAQAQVQLDLLAKQYELDKENINNSVYDQEVKDKELEKLNATYNANVSKANTDAANKQNDLKQKELLTAQAIQNRKFEVVLDDLQKETQALSQELDKRNTIQNQNRDNQIQATEASIQKQQDLAARGLANTLAYQQQQLAKEQLAAQDAAKKQAKQKENIALAEALLNAYNSELKQPNANPNTAAVKALGDVLLFKGLAAGLVQFAHEGNERVKPAKGGKAVKGKDTIPFMLEVDEGVVTADANMSNPGVVASLNKGTFDKEYVPRFDLSKDINSTAKNIHESMLLQTNMKVISLLEEIKDKPVQQWDADGLGNIIETEYRNALKIVTTHKTRRKRF